MTRDQALHFLRSLAEADQPPMPMGITQTALQAMAVLFVEQFDRQIPEPGTVPTPPQSIFNMEREPRRPEPDPMTKRGWWNR